MRTKLKLHSKEPSLEQIGKHFGTFNKDKGPSIPPDAAPEPKLPPRERLAEMAKRYARPQLRSIEGGKPE